MRKGQGRSMCGTRGGSLEMSCTVDLRYSMVQHYSDITWASWHLKSTETRLFVQQLVQTHNKENIKALHYRLFGRGIPALRRESISGFSSQRAMWKIFPYHNVIKNMKQPDTQYFVQYCKASAEICPDFNSLAPGRFQFNFRLAIFKLILMNGGWGISYKITLRWMPLDLSDDKSTLVQVMAWCRQATSHYLSQCWPRSLSPYGVTRPQWVKLIMDIP